jgi:hypothetical protein
MKKKNWKIKKVIGNWNKVIIGNLMKNKRNILLV